MTAAGDGGTDNLEIERTFLLRRCPILPEPIERLEIEQGYLPGDGELEGRLRRVRREDGRIDHVHTVKRGSGLVRQEVERPISAEEFDRHWSATQGRRLRKTRHRVAVGAIVWEIDVFHDLPPVEGRPLCMAEVEIPQGIDPASVPIPGWLSPEVLREVTEEPRFRNFALATASARI